MKEDLIMGNSPNTGDSFISDLPPPVSKNPQKRLTMAYSYVDEDEAKKRHGGTAQARAAFAPTELMPAMQTQTSVQKIVSEMCERDIIAWTALPITFREAMLQNPEDFLLIPNMEYSNSIPNVRYKGIELKWNGDIWFLFDMVK